MQKKPAFKPHLVVPGASVDAKYHCHRCNRNLPDLAFHRLVSLEAKNAWALQRNANVLYPICRSCTENARGKHVAHPLYKPSIDRFFCKLASSLKGGARTRGIAVFIDKDDLLGLYLEQEGKCALTGTLMVLDSGKSAHRNRVRPSIDRVDSGGNYTLDNIQLICAQLNLMKGGMSQVDFLRWCNKVVEYRGNAEDDLLMQVS